MREDARMVSRGSAALAVLWAAGTVAATTVGLLAVSLVGDQVSGPVASPLTSRAIQEELGAVAATKRTSDERLPTPSRGTASGRARTLTTEAGIVSVRCSDEAPVLLYATPADGYRTERSGSARAALVRFVGTTRQVTVTAVCRDDRAQVSVVTARVSSRPPTAAPAPEPQTQPGAATPPEQSEQPEPLASPEPSHELEPSEPAQPPEPPEPIETSHR